MLDISDSPYGKWIYIKIKLKSLTFYVRNILFLWQRIFISFKNNELNPTMRCTIDTTLICSYSIVDKQDWIISIQTIISSKHL